MRRALAQHPEVAKRFEPILNGSNRIRGYSAAVNEPRTLPLVGLAAEKVTLAGSVRKLCYVCMARTWLSPQAQKVIIERAAAEKLSLIICDRCAIGRQDEVMAHVRRLDAQRQAKNSTKEQ